MNHTYRLVWNAQSQRYVPAPECARAQGKSRGGKAIKPAALALVAAFALPAFAAPPAPNTLPTGGNVVAGQAGIAQSGSQMTITQGSDKAILNWQSFDIGSQAAVTFKQPSSNAVALNRVVAGDASQIYGQLNANGQVWLINPNGIIFGAGSRVNVGGLVASTLDTTNEDFLAGKAIFTRGSATGGIENHGEITATGDGNGGGLVALLAPTVQNEGIITARLGNVALAAGDRITLDAGADGLLQVAVDPATVKTLIDNKQLIVADGGQVIMTGKAADALSASVVSNSGTIQARSLAEKEGRILLLADMQHGQVQAAGELTARFVETSAADVQIDKALQVNTGGGEWLIDPVNIVIDSAKASAIQTALGSGNVTVTTADSGTNPWGTNGSAGDAGNIDVNSTITWSSHVLTLRADNDINLNATLTSTGATASDGLVLQYAQTTSTGDYHVNAPVNLAAGSLFQTQKGADAAITYTVITSLGVEGSTTGTDLQGINGNLSGNYVLGANIDASATATWNDNGSGGYYGFAPIGNSGAHFTGIFDGLGHTINNLTINRPTTNYVGLFGYTYMSTVRNVGLVGGSVTGNDSVGGLTGININSTVQNSYATGSVTGNNSVGGLVGWNGASSSVQNSYATGDVTGNDYVGGLVGRNTSSSSVQNSYATGSVSDTTGSASWIGGLVGSSSTASVVNSFWDTQTTGQATSAWGTGKTTAEMQQQATFSGWDFANTWRIYEGESYPVLQSFQQTLTVTANNATKTYDGGAYSGGNGITQSTPGALSGAVTYGGSSQGAVNAGSYTITPDVAMTQQDYQNWHVSYQSGTLTIDPAVLTTTITGSLIGTVGKTYDGTTTATLNPANFLLTGWVGSDGASVTKTTGSYDNANAGSGKTVTVSLTNSDYSATGSTNLANYTLPTSISGAVGVINPALLTVTANNAGKTYDGSPWSGGNGVSYSGFVSGQNASVLAGTLAYGGTSQGAVNAGSYSIVPSGLFSSNYSISYVNGNLTISPVVITPEPVVTPITGSLTGTVGKTYDGTATATLNPANFLLTGWVGSDGASVTKTTGSYDNANAGSGKTVTVSLTNSDYSATGSTNLANYILPTSISGTVGVITPAQLTVTASNGSKIYDGLAWSGNSGVTFSGFVAGQDASVLSGTLAYGGTSQGAVNAGGYSIVPSGLSSSNYSISYVNGNLSISPASLVITANDASKPYDGITWSGGNGVNYTGFVAGEDASVLSGVLAYGGTSQGAVEAGNYSIQPFGLSSGNYAISYVNGTLNISPAPQPEPQTPPASNDTVAPDGGKIWHAENPQLQAQPIPPLMLTNATNTGPASGMPFLSLAPGFIRAEKE